MTGIDLKKPVLLFVLAWITGLLFLLDLAVNYGDPRQLIQTYSALSCLLMIALFRRQARLATMVFLIGLATQPVWLLDLVLYKFGTGLGRTALLAASGEAQGVTASLLRIVLVPVSIIAVLKLGFDRKAFLPAIGLWAVLVFLAQWLTPAGLNVNCVFAPCDTVPAVAAGGGYFLKALVQGALFITWISFLCGLVLALPQLVKERFHGHNA